MKLLHKLMVVMFLAGASHLSAQNGSTTVSGQNPQEEKAKLAQQSSVARVNPNETPQDGNRTLGPAYQASMCRLNYTTATVKLGQRFSPPGVPQPATFTISGIPSGSTIVKAFIWCDASGNGAPINLSVTNPLGFGFSIPMTLVGSDIDKCWGYAGSTTYRADATTTVPAGPVLNGNYVMSGFPTGSPNDVDGATLVLIYQEPVSVPAYQGDIVIWDGAMVGIGTNTSVTMNGFQACQGNIFNSRAFMGIGDLQGLGSQMTLNNVFPITTTEDWWNFVDVPTTVTPGQTTSLFGNNSTGDCYNIAVAGLYFQSSCSNCEYHCEALPDFRWDGCNPVSFTGTNGSISPVASWFWQFGDGQTSTLQNPTHTYATGGVYKVCLTIIAQGSDGSTCCNQVCREIRVCNPPPCDVKPEFHWYTTPNNQLLAYFNDATVYSGGTICNYVVDFGDGSPVYTGSTPPTYHIYTTPGTYLVCWEVDVCVYDRDGNIISRCADKICHKITVGPNADSGRMNTHQNGGFEQTPPAIDVFPNPTTSLLNITLGDGISVQGQVRILDASGQEVAVAKQSGKNTYQVDMSRLSAGIYFVVVQNTNGAVNKQVFVKQ